MDESKVLFLIAEGEGATIEFKRELDLSSAKGKAEFIKDIISLANSARDVGYMLIGVDKNKFIVGISNLEEERIQQVAQTYIDPPISLNCRIVPINQPAMTIVGIIAITPTTKPHKVIRSIGHIVQNQVFIRHGSVVVEASPDEVIAMRDETQFNSEARPYTRAAETHMQLGNWANSIAAYSKAIELTPDAKLFLARGKAYQRLCEIQADHREKGKWAKLAHKDFSDTLSLSPPMETEREARFGRLHIYGDLPQEVIQEFAHRLWEEDLNWFKARGEDRDYGHALVIEVETYHGFALYIVEVPEEAFAKLEKAINLGYTEPDAYYLRATANFFRCNYGLALSDIDTAISKTQEFDPKLSDCLALRAAILSKRGKYDSLHPERFFQEAFENLQRAHQLNPNFWNPIGGFTDTGIEIEVLYRYIIDWDGEDSNNEIRRSLIQVITLYFSQYGKFCKSYPQICNLVREIVGEEFWQANRVKLE